MITKLKSIIKNLIPNPKLGPFGWFFLFVHTWHIYHIHQIVGVVHLKISLSSILLQTALISYSYLTLYLLLQLIKTISSRNRAFNISLNLFVLLFYSFFVSYLYTTKTTFDYAILISNFTSTFSREALSLVVGTLLADPIAIALAAIIVFSILEKKYKTISRYREQLHIFKKSILLFVIYILLLILPSYAYDEFANFFKTAINYYHNPYTKLVDYQKGSYPLIKEQLTLTTTSEAATPNIFIIIVESFRTDPIEKISNNKELTPNFNKLIKTGLYIDNFYGNSIQTCKGHFSTLFSMIPSFFGNVYSNFPDTKLKSLPSILEKQGFETIFFQGHEKINFDNTYNFLSSNGFNVIETCSNLLKEEDKKYVWGWGPEDHIFYKRFFEFLDTKHKSKPSKPIFACLATISNHMRFDFMPNESKLIYPNPKNMKESFANSIHLTDKDLPIFFQELAKRNYLENSLIIILGDHSYPLGEHGIWYTENGFYNESFKVPFLAIWKNEIKPQRIKDTAFSQLDIAPTVLDLLNIQPKKHHFQGNSILKKEQNPIYLIQPYNGIYLSVVKHPLKYIKHLRTKKEYIFNLKIDPGEKSNLIKKYKNSKELEILRSELKTIYLNQLLIQKNKVFHEN